VTFVGSEWIIFVPLIFMLNELNCAMRGAFKSEPSETEEAAEKLQNCHSEGGVSPRNLLFPGIGEKADPSLRSG
jgi:hypothetical protein